MRAEVKIDFGSQVWILLLQALFSACAKMCVRELRKTETANVSVFYLSFCSTIGALCGCFGPKIFGYEHTVRLPYNHVEVLLLLGVGKQFPISAVTCTASDPHYSCILASSLLLKVLPRGYVAAINTQPQVRCHPWKLGVYVVRDCQ